MPDLSGQGSASHSELFSTITGASTMPELSGQGSASHSELLATIAGASTMPDLSGQGSASHSELFSTIAGVSTVPDLSGPMMESPDQKGFQQLNDLNSKELPQSLQNNHKQHQPLKN
ncbi:hypothetical protein QQP08_012743 [Theobroma cacao]|nr:hypothetical protein QQP08_012743 [Theobroma cacao]